MLCKAYHGRVERLGKGFPCSAGQSLARRSAARLGVTLQCLALHGKEVKNVTTKHGWDRHSTVRLAGAVLGLAGYGEAELTGRAMQGDALTGEALRRLAPQGKARR